MPQYFITYLGGDKPSSPEEGKQHFAKYKEWLSSLGDSAVSPANPFIQGNGVRSFILTFKINRKYGLVLCQDSRPDPVGTWTTHL
jgi:hypothetical protein